MALVPAGHVKKMRGQMFKFAQIDPNAGQKASQPTPQPDPRLQVEQDQIGEQDPQAAPGQLTQQEPNGEDIVAPQSIEKPEATDEEGGGESDIKDAWRAMLIQLGVPDRMLDSIEKQLYSEETDLQSNTIKGHYMIPTYTKDRKVTKQDALNLARKMEQKFGLTSRMKLEGRNWRIDFQSRPKQEFQEGGSSFDELISNKQQQQKAASAMTLGEMLESRRQELFETMRKFAIKE